MANCLIKSAVFLAIATLTQGYPQSQEAMETSAGFFLRVTGAPYKKDFYDYTIDLDGEIPLDTDLKTHDFPLDLCGAYDYSKKGGKICQYETGSSECEEIRDFVSTQVWTRTGNQKINDKCPNAVSAALERLGYINYYYISKANQSGSTGLKLIMNVTNKLVEESLQQCGINDDAILLKINEGNVSPWGWMDPCTFIFLNRDSGGGSEALQDCDRKIQLCNSDGCRPLSDGKTKANVIFRIEGSETSNNLCPKVILQMDANGWHDWTGKGSTFYVSY